MGRKKTKYAVICPICKSEFDVHPSSVKRGKGKYCSRKCWGIAERGKTLSPEARQKVSEARKGKPLTKEHKEKLWANRSRYVSDETRAKLSMAHKGKKNVRALGNKYRLGKYHSIETRRIISAKVPHGEKHPRWKGGFSRAGVIIRESIEGRVWRDSVFRRDDWTCQKCGKRNGDHNAHHIKPFALYEELRFDIDNGITLCVPCHKVEHGLQHRT